MNYPEGFKHGIWSNFYFDYDAELHFLEETYPNESEDFYDEVIWEKQEDTFNVARSNLNIRLGNPILVIADLGLWNGRCSGYKEIESGNIADCLSSQCDYATWYVDKRGDLRFEGKHHDGTNHYLYRVWKTEASETAKDNLRAKLYDGTATRADITRVTRRLGDYIAEVYGWTDIAPRKKKCEVA